MNRQDYNEKIQELVSLDLEKAAKGIDTARKRIADVIVQLHSAGGVAFLPRLNQLEDRLETLKNNTNDINQALKNSEIAKVSEDDARRDAFYHALADARWAARRIIELLDRAIALTVNSGAVHSDKVLKTDVVRAMAWDFERKFSKAINKMIADKKNDTRRADEFLADAQAPQEGGQQ